MEGEGVEGEGVEGEVVVSHTCHRPVLKLKKLGLCCGFSIHVQVLASNRNHMCGGVTCR